MFPGPRACKVFTGLPQGSPVLNVLECWSFIACEKLCCLHHLLYSFTLKGSRPWTPHGDAAAVVTLCTYVTCSEDVGSRVDFPCCHHIVILIHRDCNP